MREASIKKITKTTTREELIKWVNKFPESTIEKTFVLIEAKYYKYVLWTRTEGFILL